MGLDYKFFPTRNANFSEIDLVIFLFLLEEFASTYLFGPLFPKMLKIISFVDRAMTGAPQYRFKSFFSKLKAMLYRLKTREM